MSARRQGRLLGAYTAFVFAFLFVPVLMVVLFSFNKTASFTFPFHGWSFQWYRSVFSSPDYRGAIWASLKVALVTVLIVASIGTLAAIAVTRYTSRGREVLRSVFLVPAALPGLFLGIALLSLFIRTKTDLSLGTATVGHVIYTLPYFFLVASSRLLRFDPLLEESARDLGASWWTTFRKVTLPIIAPALIAGALVVFSLSWDEVLITFFTIGSQNTLPLLIYSKVKQASDPSINAISTLLLTGSLVFIVGVRKFVVDIQS
jgi:spermidine/putrescine transport system permease protein